MVEPTALAPLFTWHLRPETPVARDALTKLGHPPLVAQVLANRNVGPEEVAGFLEPKLKDLPDPSTLPDFDKAIEVFLRAVAEDHAVLIHGDYDVDGTCGSAILLRLFRRMGLRVEVFLPDREQDGYSFGPRSLTAVREQNAKVVVAVDNGTTAFQPLEELASMGVSTVIVDHHPPGDRRPECAALVNPWTVPGAGEPGGPFPHFCGGGLAWMMAWGALRAFHEGGDLPEADRIFLKDSLALAAIATVGDVMPLRGPNRALVCAGLGRMRESSFPGLPALVKNAGIRGNPTARDIGFRIGPRLNAAGRLLRGEVAFRALTTDDPVEARKLADELEELNLRRRSMTEAEEAAFAPEVEAQIAAGRRVIFAGRQDAPFGVLGIVANRFLDRTGHPVFLWGGIGDGTARGSARGPEGWDLASLLAAASPPLKGGGHARAAGFEFDPADADAAAEALEKAADGLGDPPAPGLAVDAEVRPGDLTSGVVHALEGLRPWGESFPEARFLCTGMKLLAAPKGIGDGSHAELQLERDGEAVRVLAWRMMGSLAHLQAGTRVDVIFHPGINRFRGRASVEWTLEDLRTVED